MLVTYNFELKKKYRSQMYLSSQKLVVNSVNDTIRLISLLNNRAY